MIGEKDAFSYPEPGRGAGGEAADELRQPAAVPSLGAHAASAAPAESAAADADAARPAHAATSHTVPQTSIADIADPLFDRIEQPSAPRATEGEEPSATSDGAPKAMPDGAPSPTQDQAPRHAHAAPAAAAPVDDAAGAPQEQVKARPGGGRHMSPGAAQAASAPSAGTEAAARAIEGEQQVAPAAPAPAVAAPETSAAAAQAVLVSTSPAQAAHTDEAAERAQIHPDAPSQAATSPSTEAEPEAAPESAIGTHTIPDPAADTSPEDTAEIDVAAVEAKLSDPGSTQSFEAITEDRIDADSTFDAGTTTSLMWGARSDVGCVRGHNEDSYLVASPLFCVCDGMGGHAAGEVASAIAVETIAKTAPKAANPALLGAAIEAANAAVIEAAVNGVGKPGMGCTATAAYVDGNTLAIAHVGDSRAYLLHEGTLIRVTRDHSYVEELVDAGEITADEARVHPNRSVITRALGSDPAMYADHFQLGVQEGDRLILCSDGLSSMVPDGDIETIATQSSTAQICTDNLVDAALAAGGADNVTVVVVDIVNDGHLKRLALKRRRNILVGLAIFAAIVALAAGITFMSITGSVYLGVKDDTVAIYTGIPNAPFGLKLHWLEDETSVRLADLPEDTQNRLRGGIPQDNMDEANRTIANYRDQIEEQKSRQEQDAAAIRSSREQDSSSGGSDTASSDADGTAAATDSTTDATPEGGAAQ